MGGWLFYWEKNVTEHVSIIDAQRHEPKHASTAVLNTVNKSNGDGTTKYDFVAYAELSGKPSSRGYQPILYGASTAASQQPSATNSAIQLEFGPAQSFTDVTLSSAGLVTFLTGGEYLIDVFLRFGRTSATGQSIMFNRLLINGSQALRTNSITLDNAINTIPFSACIPISVNAGDTLAMQLYRDSAGVNNGGLFQTTPSLSGWAVSPSASIQVAKLRGLV